MIDSQSALADYSPLRSALAGVQNAMRFVEHEQFSRSQDTADVKVKRGLSLGYVPFLLSKWRTRHDSNMRPPDS